MNAFDQYEVWFVTGAQLLYGGDAVIAVDAHSNEMVNGLNESGKLPVKEQPILLKKWRLFSKQPIMMKNVLVSSHGCILSLRQKCGFTVCNS